MCIHIYTHVNLYIIRRITNHIHSKSCTCAAQRKIKFWSTAYSLYKTLQHTATHCNTQILVNSKFTRAVFHDTFRSAHEVNAVCCSVLQCVAVCCSVLQCLSQNIPVCPQCNAVQCVAVCCSVLQCVVVRCSVLQCVATCCSVLPREYAFIYACAHSQKTHNCTHTHTQLHTPPHTHTITHTHTLYIRTQSPKVLYSSVHHAHTHTHTH